MQLEGRGRGVWGKGGVRSRQGACTEGPWAWTVGWGLSLGVGVGRGRGEQWEVEGNGDNCN